MKEIRLANKIIKILVKDRIQYPGRLIVDTISIIARCGILLALYWYVYNVNGGAVNGTSYAIVAWSMFFYFAFSTWRLRDISRAIMQDVQSGNVEILFSKPISYLAYRTWWTIGSGLYSFLVAGLIGSLALGFFVGLPSTMKIGIFLPSFLLVFAGASILSLVLYSIVGLMAFWMEDINPIYWIVDKTVMILGGSYLPVALFPDFMHKLAIYSPFGASQFITHTTYASWKDEWINLTEIQAFWIIALGIVAYRTYLKAREKVSINGG